MINMNLLAAVFCIVLFSLTVPFTRVAALAIPAELVVLYRLIGAGMLCLFVVMWDGWIPPRRIWLNLAATALGSVIGFAAFTSFAMKQVPSGHAAVALAAMPIATAAYSVLRDRSKPGKKFWLFALLGTLFSFGFFFFMKVDEVLQGDIFLIFAVFCGAFGYVEGGRLSREFSGTRIMSWSVLLTLPFTLAYFVYFMAKLPVDQTFLSREALLSVGYLALVSQSLGMFLWLKVLAIGPMEKIALVQLLQPFLTLLASIAFLGETVIWPTWIVALLVAACVFGAQKEKGKASLTGQSPRSNSGDSGSALPTSRDRVPSSVRI
jgi:drug/metabolite transporter (DMT)-like permease